MLVKRDSQGFSVYIAPAVLIAVVGLVGGLVGHACG